MTDINAKRVLLKTSYCCTFFKNTIYTFQNHALSFEIYKKKCAEKETNK